MFAAGLVEEVGRLLADPHGLSKAARQAVGYAEVIDYWEGKQSMAATVELVKSTPASLPSGRQPGSAASANVVS